MPNVEGGGVKVGFGNGVRAVFIVMCRVVGGVVAVVGVKVEIEVGDVVVVVAVVVVRVGNVLREEEASSSV